MKILFCLGCTALAVILFNELGNKLDPIMTRWWVFAPAHFTAGMFLGVFAMYVAHGFRRDNVLAWLLAFVFVVGVAWEIMEYIVYDGLPWYDTVSDIIVDLLGGYIGYRLIGEHRA